MSYEGYEQHICKNGHLFHNYDIYQFKGEEVRCYCGAESAWCNAVDDTNCYQEGFIPEDLFRSFSYSVLAIPTEKELKKMQTYNEGDGLRYLDSQELVVFPIYKLCVYRFEVCTGVGTEYAQFPQNNPCS